MKTPIQLYWRPSGLLSLNYIISTFQRIIPGTMPGDLKISTTQKAQVIINNPDDYKLQLSSVNDGAYQLAQLDDYSGSKRKNYKYSPPIRLELDARASTSTFCGTWGFGFWNAPLSTSLGYGGNFLLPALPQSAWFFYSSIKSYLSFRDDLPANGMLAQAFRSLNMPAYLLAPALPAIMLLYFKHSARFIRSMISSFFVKEDSASISEDWLTSWQSYRIDWHRNLIRYFVNDEIILETKVSPHPPLGLVIWIDNQFAAFTPEGRIRSGLHSIEKPAEMHIRNLHISQIQAGNLDTIPGK